MKEPLMEERERERERESVSDLYLPLFFFFLGCRLFVLELTRSSDLFLIWSLFGHSSSSPESTSSFRLGVDQVFGSLLDLVPVRTLLVLARVHLVVSPSLFVGGGDLHPRVVLGQLLLRYLIVVPI